MPRAKDKKRISFWGKMLYNSPKGSERMSELAYASTWDIRVNRLTDSYEEDYASKIQVKRYYEITYCLAGEVVYHIGAETYTVRPGDLLLLTPGETFARTVRKGTVVDRLWIGFEREWLERIGMEQLLEPFESRRHGQGNLIHPEQFRDDFWQQTLLQLTKPGVHREMQARTCIQCLLWSIYEVFSAKGGATASVPLSMQIVEYVNLHLVTQNLEVNALAEHFHISRASLYRLFKAETGLPIGEYMTKKRLQTARSMMLGGVIPKKACAICGFHDYSTFYRAYKRVFGIAPSDAHKHPAGEQD